MRLFLIKDEVFLYNIFTLPSKPVGNRVITENLSLYEINTSIYFRILRPVLLVRLWTHQLEIPKEFACILVKYVHTSRGYYIV